MAASAAAALWRDKPVPLSRAERFGPVWLSSRR
jgi:hypothetical protein